MCMNAHVCMNLRLIVFLSAFKESLLKATDYRYIIKDLARKIICINKIILRECGNTWLC